MHNLIFDLNDYIQNNTKDFVNICFWVFTAGLAYRTYINAKKTLFNPIRSEMVKYQMRVITEFIDNHTSKGLNFDFSIDYLSLIKINYDVDYCLDKLENNSFNESEVEYLNYCKENLAGLFEIAKKDDIHYFEHTIIGDFDIIKQYVQTRYIKAKEANHKELPLQRLYFSKKFYSLYSDLLNLQTNPFIPKEIKVHIKNTIDNIEKNLHSLYISLSIYMTKEKAESYREILTHFEPQKIDHQKDLEKFRNVITEYFKVNKI